jgi:predicted O-linked N-acetylglucosamine transferase (SPINDLY family)
LRESKQQRARRAATLAQAALEHHRAGRLGDAVSLYEQAVGLAVPSAALLSNLGEAYRRLDRKVEAVETFRRALKLQPQLAGLRYNLGLTLDQLGRCSEAASEYERAIELDPSLPNAPAFLLQVLRDGGDYQRAIDSYSRLRQRVPDSAELRRAVANAFADLFRVDEAEPHFLRALELAPDSADVRIDYAAALAERGEIQRALTELRRAVELDPTNVRAHSSLVYLSAFSPSADPAAILAEARRFDARHASALPRKETHDNSRAWPRRLRVGYVSPDFRRHPSALFVPGLLRHHDRTAVEVYCYSNVRQPDEVTREMQGLSDQWRDIAELGDDAAASLVARDRIDVLVDLAMHSGLGRPLLFARKPAPVQVCWLAYLGTTGIRGMDYRLTDPILDPPGTYDGDYSERSLRLPDCFWCYGPSDGDPEVGELPALTRGYVTFGSANSFKKVSDDALSLWASVLNAIPSSRMRIFAPEGQSWARVEQAFLERGVAAERLTRLAHVPRSQYLLTFNEVDFCLDSTPYAGGTTSLDAFWMGVPVLTLLGRTVAGRAGASLAHNLGLPQLVAASQEELVARAQLLVRDLASLAELRTGLRSRMRASPLMDQPRFARAMEAAYVEIFRRWCDASGHAPAGQQEQAAAEEQPRDQRASGPVAGGDGGAPNRGG